MSLPRAVIPGRFYLVTRRCVQRTFLLRPDDDTNNAYTYCLAEAAMRFSIDVLLMCAMSNHHHVVIYDRDGRFPEFLHRFHQLFARSQNALRGRWENLWAAEAPSVVCLVDAEDVLRKLEYVALNPVKDHLVDAVHHWPGVNGYGALIRNKPLTATRPDHFFRSEGTMPETVILELVIPPRLGPRDEIVRELQARVELAEAQLAEERRRKDIRIVGRRRVLAQSCFASPKTHEPRRNPSPRIAAKNKWARIEAIQRDQEFIRDYRQARTLWLAGTPTTFPIGTYWLRRFAAVPIGRPPDRPPTPAPMADALTN